MCDNLKIKTKQESIGKIKLYNPLFTPLFAAKLTLEACKSIKQWWDCEISGQRCVKQIVDSGILLIGTAGGEIIGGTAGALTGGSIGYAIGNLFGPIGGIFGKPIGENIGWLYGSFIGRKIGIETAELLSNWLNLHLFDLPKDKSVENAFLFMNLSHHASNEEINKRYRELCLKHHPDKGGKVEDFQKLQCSMAIIRLSKGYNNEKQEQEQEEHKPKEIKLNVLYFNARSINPVNTTKISFLKNRIESLKPDIVAITETWLKNDIDNNQFAAGLSLQDYRIYRCDRQDINQKGEIRKGGGILIAVKVSQNLEPTLIEHFNDNYIYLEFNYLFNCQKCSQKSLTNFFFCLVYRRGNLYADQKLDNFKNEDSKLLDNLKRIADFQDKGLFVGDFNFKINCDTDKKSFYNSWIEIPTTLLNLLRNIPVYEGINQEYVIPLQREFNSEMITKGYKQLVQDATHGSGNILDLIFAKPDLFVGPLIKNLGHIPSENRDEETEVKGTNLDHVMLYFNLNIGTDCDKQIFL